jgi:hypothetical protein
MGNATYSNANAKSGCFAPGLEVIKDRDHCAEHVGLYHCDSTEGLVSLLNVVVAVVAIFAVWLQGQRVILSYSPISPWICIRHAGSVEHFCATAIPFKFNSDI